MEARYYLTCLWPGLAELWWRGRLSALPAAVAFMLAFNLFLVARYLYPQWIAGGLVSLGFWVGLFVWVFYVIRSVRELPALISPRSISDQPDRFPEARNAYLRGDWTEAEGLLTDVLAIEPRDPPALLLLTGVYRHTGRLEAATLLLREIRRLEIADHWWLEVEGESERLSRAVRQAESSGSSEGVAGGTARKGEAHKGTAPAIDSDSSTGEISDSDVEGIAGEELSDAADLTEKRPQAA